MSMKLEGETGAVSEFSVPGFSHSSVKGKSASVLQITFSGQVTLDEVV